jgi:hypothetical protein
VPRSHRHRRAEHLPLRSAALTRRESAPDGDWVVRSVPGSSAGKDYRCPGCQQLIRAGTGHVVAWLADEPGSVADRRHWHAGCWSARSRRRPG